MTAELKKHDVKTLISMVTPELDKLLALPLDAEPSPHPNDEELEKGAPSQKPLLVVCCRWIVYWIGGCRRPCRG